VAPTQVSSSRSLTIPTRTYLDVPGTGYGFGDLIGAQPAGDLQALRARGRRVLRVRLGGDTIDDLGVLKQVIHG
jgi:hypothetical protein